MFASTSRCSLFTCSWQVLGLLTCACTSTAPSTADSEANVGRAVEAGSDARSWPAATTPRHPSLVRVVTHSPQGNRVCAGAVVARDQVVTTRHCTAQTTSSEFQCPASGPQIEEDTTPAMIAVVAAADADDTPLAWAQRVDTPPTRILCDGDIAVLHLDRFLDAPPLPLTRDAVVRTGQRLTLVHMPGRAADRSAVSDATHMTDASASAVVVATSEREFSVEGASCRDMGGGLALEADTGALLGIATRGAMVCADPGTISVFTRLAAFLPLFDAPSTPATPDANPDANPDVTRDENAASPEANGLPTLDSGGATLATRDAAHPLDDGNLASDVAGSSPSSPLDATPDPLGSAPATLGAPCSKDRDCGAGRCLLQPEQTSGGYCTRPCGAGLPRCSRGFRCVHPKADGAAEEGGLCTRTE